MAQADDEYKLFGLEIAQERYVGCLEDPASYIHEIAGRVVAEDEGGTVCSEAGTFAVVLVDAEGAATQRISAFDVFDTTQKTFNYYQSLYEGERFSERLFRKVDRLSFPWTSNLLILDRLIIHPAYRGQRLGLETLVMLMQRFQSGAQIVAIDPFPLQFEYDVTPENRASRGLAEFTASKDYSIRRLRRYYSQIGFTAVRGAPYMVRPTSVPLTAP